MLTLTEIEDFLKEQNYDIKKSHNGRWIDQKCTPDVIWSVADFVLNYVDNVKTEFTVRDIWQSDYAAETIAETYSKPETNEETARNEYDKVFSQPLCLFCYAGILEDISTTTHHLYVIKNRAVLEYIAKNDSQALRFLYCYIEKVLTDSDLISIFNDFFDNQDNAHFQKMKQDFINFYHEWTPIQGDFEPKRIFTKVLNPLAFKNDKKGTIRGRMSSDKIKKADMMYNRDNFRDVYRDKPKGMSRQEWIAQNPNIDIREGYFRQMMSRAKKTLGDSITENRRGISELTQFNNNHNDYELATQKHHIFPKNEFPEIMHYIENLIALTPNQHYGFAHPRNNTQIIDLAAQKELLISKTCSIEKNLTSGTEEPIYEFSNLLNVLSVGWNDDEVLDIDDNDYIAVVHSINCHY